MHMKLPGLDWAVSVIVYFKQEQKLWVLHLFMKGFMNIFSGGVLFLPNFTVQPGDIISPMVFYDAQYQDICFWVINNSNGDSYCTFISITAQQFGGGNYPTAEFIDERPGEHGTNNLLANFGTVPWKNCMVSTDTGEENGFHPHEFGLYPYERCDMVWQTAQLTSLSAPFHYYPSSLSDDAFTDTFQHSDYWYNPY